MKYETSHRHTFTITRFRDGDTVEGFIQCGSCRECHKETLRLPKIESWEPKGPESAKALEAARWLTDLYRGLSGFIATNLSRRDPYGRLIADVMLGDDLLSSRIVAQGYAWYGVGEHIHGKYPLPPTSTDRMQSS